MHVDVRVMMEERATDLKKNRGRVVTIEIL